MNSVLNPFQIKILKYPTRNINSFLTPHNVFFLQFEEKNPPHVYSHWYQELQRVLCRQRNRNLCLMSGRNFINLECTYNIPKTFVFIDNLKQRHFCGETCGCCQPWGRSGKCSEDLLSNYILFVYLLRYTFVHYVLWNLARFQDIVWCATIEFTGNHIATKLLLKCRRIKMRQ